MVYRDSVEGCGVVAWVCGGEFEDAETDGGVEEAHRDGGTETGAEGLDRGEGGGALEYVLGGFVDAAFGGGGGEAAGAGEDFDDAAGALMEG